MLVSLGAAAGWEQPDPVRTGADLARGRTDGMGRSLSVVSDNAETGPGLPPAHHDLGSLRLSKLSVGPHDNNAYVLTDVASDSVLLVDAAAEPTVLIDLLMGHDVVGILTTHRHPDHWAALNDVVRSTGALTYAHEADADGLPFPPDVVLAHGDEISIGESTVTVRHVPGHTPGSLVVIVHGSEGPVHLLTGDALFPVCREGSTL